MIIKVDMWEDLFSEIRADIRTSEEKKVTVFVSSTECDSVCATRIFQAGDRCTRLGCSASKFSLPQSTACMRRTSCLMLTFTTVSSQWNSTRSSENSVAISSRIRRGHQALNIDVQLNTTFLCTSRKDMHQTASHKGPMHFASPFDYDQDVQSEYRNLFFINCGASQDLKELLGLAPEATRAIVIDSHRCDAHE